MMKKAHDFDFVFDCQEVFRKLLEAFSNPGRIVDISTNADRLNTSYRACLAVAATLIDNETAFCVIGSDELADLVQQFTYARSVALEESDFVFVTNKCECFQMDGILSSAPSGSMEEPHKSGIVLVRMEEFSPAPGCALKGPGINGEIQAPLGPYAEAWLKARRAAAHEYPCGVDIAFITDEGQIVAAPRLVQLV
jgi:alpha-D-ribose 1-methylphosphonate 5-triphosphate synthase subunit PhnH